MPRQTKCSGERSGCSRCSTLGVDCIYVESKVGRVPGVRAKKKNDSTARGTAEMTAHTRAMGSLSPNTSNTANDTIEVNFFSPRLSQSQSRSPRRDPVTLDAYDDVVLDWSADLNQTQDLTVNNDFNFDDTHENDLFQPLSPTCPDPQQQQQQQQQQQTEPLPSQSQPQSQPQTQSQPQQQLSPISSGSNRTYSRPAMTEYPVLTLDFDLSDVRRPISRSRNFEPHPYPINGAQTPHNLDLKINSQCVITCSQIILSLEKYLLDQLKVLDLILGIVKQVVEKLNPLIGGQLGPCNMKCIALFSTILYQVVELLEAGCTSFLSEAIDNNLAPYSSNPLGGGLHSFGFVGFGTNSGDQRRYRSKIVLEELQPIMDTMRKVALLTSSGKGYDDRGGGQERIGWCHETESRLQLLIEKIRRQGYS